MAFKVYISPSNQPLNKYNGVNTNERDNCREIAKKLKIALEKCGITVKIGLNGSDNIAESNAWGADLHLPLHTNAFNKKARGAMVLVYSKDKENLKFANPIFKHLKSVVLKQDSTRGITVRQDLKEINSTKAVTAYIEIDFHDVKTVAKWLVNKHDVIVAAITKGICEGANIEYPQKSDALKIKKLKKEISSLKAKIKNAQKALK